MQYKFASTHIAAAMLLAPVAFLAQPAVAQQRAIVAPAEITSLAVNSDAGVTAGATLRLQMYATPRARNARVMLPGVAQPVALAESSRGNYTGSYVVRRADRIDPNESMRAQLTVGRTTITRDINWPPAFQALTLGAAPTGAAPTGAAPTPTAAIERFVMRPNGRIEPGREVMFRLRGAPGGDAWLDIPGVISGVDLAEVRPGVYEGSYMVRRRDDLAAFGRSVATLRNGNQRATARVEVRGDDRDWGGAPQQQQARRDDRAPQITDLTPAHGERVADRGRTQIGAKLADEGTGIDTASVRLRLAGRDVTSDTRITADEVIFRGDLEPGRYTAELMVKDLAGNATTKSWTFDVTDRERERVGGGPLPLQITSHTNNSVVGDGSIQLAGRTAPFATIRVQMEAVSIVGALTGLQQPAQDLTIQADRDGRFAVTLQPMGLPIPGTRYDVRLTATSGSQTAEERLTLVRRQG